MCEDNFSSVTASLLCREMGYEHGGGVWRTGLGWTTQDRYAIFLDEVSCSSEDLFFSNCSFTLQHDCIHSDDVFLDCVFERPIFSLLSDAGSPTATGVGLLVAKMEFGLKGSVCDDLFDSTAAALICDDMGHESHSASWHAADTFPYQSILPIVLDGIQCSESAARFSECSYLVSLDTKIHIFRVYSPAKLLSHVYCMSQTVIL